ncbi:MAG: prolipoprotein diacylglyceryl transferase [Actinomycetes bacterium]
MNKIFTAFPESPGGSVVIGTYTVHYYALLILAGIILAVWITGSRLKSRGAEGALSLDVALFAVPFGIVGGRAYHVVTHWNDYFSAGKDPLTALYVWEGGLAIYGALIFGIVGAVIGARISGLRFFSYVDALVPGLLLAQAIGRWGNYFNAELFGAPTTLPWGVPISSPNPALPVDLPRGTIEDPTLFTPTFLYESVWCLIGIVVLLYIERVTQPRWGKFFGLYLIWYSIGRYFIEGMRLDPSDIYFGLRTNQWAALITIVAGIALIIIQGRNHHGIEISPYRPGYVPPAPEAKKPKKRKSAENDESSLEEEIENHEEIELVDSKIGESDK